jgi:hypothetical protein
MYDLIDEFLDGKYHEQIQVLKLRYRTYFDVDGSRRRWKRLAEQRDKRIWDLETSRRNLKLENARLRKMIQELEARLAEIPVP